MITRDAEQTIRSLLRRGFPAITITGPRQAGKTTLAKAIFSDKPYVSLEESTPPPMLLNNLKKSSLIELPRT